MGGLRVGWMMAPSWGSGANHACVLAIAGGNVAVRGLAAAGLFAAAEPGFRKIGTSNAAAELERGVEAARDVACGKRAVHAESGRRPRKGGQGRGRHRGLRESA